MLAGVLAVVVSLGAISLSLMLAPWFAWPTNALSDLGVSDPPERLVFNYGLLLTGVLGLLFLPALRQTLHTPAHELAVAPLGVALVGVAGVGLFPSGHPFHFPMALTAYVGFIASVATYGVGDYFLGEHRRATATVGSGSLDGATEAVLTGGWELLGALLVNAWVLYTAARLSRDERYSNV